MKKRWIIIILALFIIAVFLIFMVLSKKIQINKMFVNKSDILGVDISHYQGEVDMEKLANQNIKFVYIKATEGSKSIDENFFVNWQNGQTSGMYIGDYHFFSFDSDGKEQAEHFINTVGVLSGTLIPVVDVEYYGDKEKNPPDKETIVSGLKEYLRLLEKEYQVKPMLYTTEKVYAKYIKESFDEYPIWIRSVYYPAKYVAGENWLFWQYSDREILEGYIGEEKYIDMNVFHGEEEELGQYLCP